MGGGIVLYSTVGLVILAGLFNAVMDIVADKFNGSFFDNEKRFNPLFWDKAKSWKNKWKWDKDKEKVVEKFLGSSTVFVWTTDAWHLCQFFYNTCWQLAIAINTEYPIIIFISLKLLYSGIFELFYSKILMKKWVIS